VNFSEQAPSKEWAGLKYHGERIADVWFKPEGEPFALTFRIPQTSFQIPDVRQRLTTENLLKAVGLATEDVESCHHGSCESLAELGQPLPPPPQDEAHLHVHVRMKAPAQAVDHDSSCTSEIPAEKWQEAEARWNAILGVEAAMDTLRISMESLRSEMDAASRHMLATEEKQHAVSADMAQWTKVRSRLVYALPKLREFIHRATWALGTPERKKLEEFFKSADRSQVSLAELEEVQKQLDGLLKERQVLSTLGATVYQDGKRLTGDVQGALRTLRSNSAANAQKKKNAARIQRRKG
jgi:hypothetical protein